MLGGALLMALATLIGALATHVLRSRLTPASFAVLQTAVLYQFVNALGLLILGTLAGQTSLRGLRVATDLLLVGVLLFSGSLYALTLGAPSILGLLTPMGGLCLIAGWSTAALTLWRGEGTQAS